MPNPIRKVTFAVYTRKSDVPHLEREVLDYFDHTLLVPAVRPADDTVRVVIPKPDDPYAALAEDHLEP